MRIKWMPGRFPLAAALISAGISALAFAGSAPDKETITGEVTAVEWDDNDQVTAVAITVTREIQDDQGEPLSVMEDYYVMDTAKGRELLKLVGKTVQATGEVTEDEEGIKTIEVSAYKVLEPKKK